MEDVSPEETQEKDRWWNRPVIASVIASIFVLIFIQPILNFLWRFLLSNIQGIVNKACAQAALGYTDIYNFSFSATATMAFYLLVISFAVGYLFSRRRESTKVERLPSWKFNVVLIVWIVSLVGGAFLGTLRLADDFEVMQLKASFYQRLTVLAPRISEQAYKEYLASWASMRNEEDYRRIVETMEADAKKNGVTLPELLSGARVAH